MAAVESIAHAAELHRALALSPTDELGRVALQPNREGRQRKRSCARYAPLRDENLEAINNHLSAVRDDAATERHLPDFAGVQALVVRGAAEIDGYAVLASAHDRVVRQIAGDRDSPGQPWRRPQDIVGLGDNLLAAETEATARFKRLRLTRVDTVRIRGTAGRKWHGLEMFLAVLSHLGAGDQGIWRQSALGRRPRQRKDLVRGHLKLMPAIADVASTEIRAQTPDQRVAFDYGAASIEGYPALLSRGHRVLQRWHAVLVDGAPAIPARHRRGQAEAHRRRRDQLEPDACHPAQCRAAPPFRRRLVALGSEMGAGRRDQVWLWQQNAVLLSSSKWGIGSACVGAPLAQAAPVVHGSYGRGRSGANRSDRSAAFADRTRRHSTSHTGGVRPWRGERRPSSRLPR